MKNPNSNKLFTKENAPIKFFIKTNKNQISFQKETQVPKEIHDNSSNIDPVSEKVSNHEQTEDEIREEEQLKFKFAAIVMDRFFLYLALIYSFITFVGLVMTNTNLYK